MPELTQAQRLMVAEGFPETLFRTADERRASWKGKKLRPTASFADLKPVKEEDPATKKLRKELEAAAEKKKAERFARLEELNRAKRPNKETDMSKTNAKTSKADQVKDLRERRAASKGAKAPAKPASKAAGKKAATAKARTPAGPKAASGAPKGVRPGSKLEIVVGLLTRKEGCTAAEVLKATDWPAVSMPQQARAAGLTLRQEKDGKVTRYWASAG